ncbi:MAG: transporter [Hespellia sp.]|nr:transporter [Hespellia sp.]
MPKEHKIRNILILQSIIVVYTLATVAAKFASGYEFLSLPFVLFYAGEIAILGIYAILWQQIIKKFDLTVAYANRAVGIFWSLVWATIFFHEAITWKNVLGIAVVFIGIMVVNSDDHE